MSASSIKRTLYKGAKTCAYALMRRCPPLRKALRKVVWKTRTQRYVKLANSIPTDPKSVAFESFKGRSYSCSPRAVFEQMQASGRFDDYTFYWMFNDDVIDDYRFLEREYANVKLVSRAGSDQFCAYARCKNWIVNSRSPEQLVPKADQRYIQTWHGTPLKCLGNDIVSGTKGALNSSEEMSQRYVIESAKWDHLVSPSRFTSDCLASAFALDEGWARAHTWEIGYPRNDYIVNTCNDLDKLAQLKERMLSELGVTPGKKLLLYAPTYRDSEFKASVGYVQDVMIDFDLLQRELGSEWVVLFRPHYFVANEFDFAKYAGFVVNAAKVADINELYCIADVLMTDYSSVFFDYACTGRPMVFFQPDLTEYKEHVRGFYLDPVADLPGPHCETSQEVVAALKGIDSYFESYGQRYGKFKQRFCPMEDGHAAQRLIELLFDEQ